MQSFRDDNLNEIKEQQAINEPLLRKMMGGIPQGNPLIPQIGSRKNFIINEKAAWEKKENKNIPLNLQKDNITVFLVMILFIHGEINWEMMTIFKESFKK